MNVVCPAWERVKAWWHAWGAWAAVVLLTALLVADLCRVWQITNHHDLDVFMRAAQRLRSGGDIFAELAPFRAAVETGAFSMQDDTVAWPYAYSPLIALLLVPATWLPESIVRVLWWVLGVFSLVASGWLILRLTGHMGPEWVALGLLVLHRFQPAVVSLRLGQIELLQLLLLTLALLLLERRRDRLAGVALGLATALKFFPGALVAVLLWRRRWRAAFWTIGVAGLLVAGAFASVGFDAIGAYLDFTPIYGIGGAFAGFPLNQSINGFVSRNLIVNVFAPTLKGLNAPTLARALIVGADLFIVAASAWLTWRPPADNRANGQRSLVRDYALALAALALVSPHSQVYTYVWLLIPLLCLARQAAALGRRGIWAWGALIVVYLLVGRDYALYQPGLTRFVQAHYLFGAALLWLAVALLIYRAKRKMSGRCPQGEQPLGSDVSGGAIPGDSATGGTAKSVMV